MLNPNACPEPEHGATTGQRADWRQRQLEVINAAADYIACGGRGVALLAAVAILTDAYGLHGRSSFQPPKSRDDSASDGKGGCGSGAKAASLFGLPDALCTPGPPWKRV